MKPVFNTLKLRNLKGSHEISFFLVDFMMMGLIILNLAWLIFDTLFASQLIQSGLQWASPGFTQFYKEVIHPDFVFYDLIFVSVFLTEFVIRWGVAVKRNTYHRWFFYPFIHWYDVVGCIPVGSFRWLRLLRVFSILYRLQKYEIIDLSSTYPVRVFTKYLNVLVEEISDRVVVNVLDGVQDEIRVGNPVVGKIVQDVVMPQRQIIVEWVTERVNSFTDVLYQPRKEELKDYIEKIVSEAIDDDPKVAALEKMPMIGAPVVELINGTVSEIVFKVIDRLVTDIGHQDTDMLVKELTDLTIEHFSEPSVELNKAGREVLIEAINVIKDEVSIQKWKEKELNNLKI